MLFFESGKHKILYYIIFLRYTCIKKLKKNEIIINNAKIDTNTI